MATARKQPGSKRLSRRSADNQSAPPAGPTFREILNSARDAKAEQQAKRETESRGIQKQRDAVAQEQVAIFRLIELADNANPQAAGEIIFGAVAVLRTPADRERLEKDYAGLSGGDSHYEVERRCILRLLLDACASHASAAKIGRQFQAARKLFSVARLRSAMEKIIDAFPRPVQEEQAREVAATLPPRPEPADIAPIKPVTALLTWAEDNLKGIEQRLVKELAARGEMPIADFAAIPSVRWRANSISDSYKSLASRVNEKINRQGYRVFSRNRIAKLEPGPARTNPLSRQGLRS